MLYWNSKESLGQRTEVGSMLKTPKFPVWLGIMGRNTVVVLFNTNINLVNDWRLEQNFMLHFYSGLKSQDVDIKLEIGNRIFSIQIKYLIKIKNCFTLLKSLSKSSRDKRAKRKVFDQW